MKEGKHRGRRALDFEVQWREVPRCMVEQKESEAFQRRSLGQGLGLLTAYCFCPVLEKYLVLQRKTVDSARREFKTVDFSCWISRPGAWSGYRERVDCRETYRLYNCAFFNLLEH